MRRKNAALLGALTLLTTGCATRMPQTAEEFRRAVPGAFTGKTEELTVKRRFGDVAAALQKRAPECLNKTVHTSSRTATSHPYIVTAYKPTVLVSNERAELHLQENHERGPLKVFEEPEGGYYRLVVDAYPLPDNSTRLQIFGPAMGYDVVIRAVKGWANGETSGCPDLTKIG